MFLAQCEILGRNALIWPSDLIGIVNTGQGMVVRYRCVCGDTAEMLTGSGRRVSLHLGVGAARAVAGH